MFIAAEKWTGQRLSNAISARVYNEIRSLGSSDLGSIALGIY
jgi:hypothetical protein